MVFSKPKGVFHPEDFIALDSQPDFVTEKWFLRSDTLEKKTDGWQHFVDKVN
ncbi:MAG TPA: hypothetical protein VNJ01_08705 [Bacteriovoracaceae bacterium]|nr:hypothetical protein [Bacteriovoracaceae bacterium]